MERVRGLTRRIFGEYSKREQVSVLSRHVFLHPRHRRLPLPAHSWSFLFVARAFQPVQPLRSMEESP